MKKTITRQEAGKCELCTWFGGYFDEDPDFPTIECYFAECCDQAVITKD